MGQSAARGGGEGGGEGGVRRSPPDPPRLVSLGVTLSTPSREKTRSLTPEPTFYSIPEPTSLTVFFQLQIYFQGFASALTGRK